MIIITAICVSFILGISVGLFAFALMIRSAARRSGGAYVFYAQSPQQRQGELVMDRTSHQAAGLVFGD